MDFDDDDTMLTGYFYKLNTPDVVETDRSRYSEKADFK